MSALDSLEGLRGIHQDLIALSEDRLPKVERLWVELEARIEDFRRLLDKVSKNDASRQTLSSGTITIDDLKYSVNDEFKESAVQLAEVLDLDEIESARILLGAQEEAVLLDRSVLATGVIHFHENRQFLLECLRLALKESTNPDRDEGIRNVLRHLIALILETHDGPARNGSLYTRKCASAMEAVEKWLLGLAERVQSAIILEQTSTPEHQEILDFEQISLAKQHESLAAIITYLVKANYTSVEDFHKLLDDHLPKLDRWTYLVVHYVPPILAFVSQYGSPEGGGGLQEARSLHTKIMENRELRPWPLRNLQAAMTCWWIAEYSGWYLDQPAGSPVQRTDPEAEARERSESFIRALADGAFECTLSISSQVTPDVWFDPVKGELMQLLLGDAPTLAPEMSLTSPYFPDLILEHFQSFADAFITNMPDTLRRLKTDEDDQRRRIYSNVHTGMQNNISEHDLHLERFFIIVSYAFEHRIEAAQSFWSDPDSNLYGFLQWASRRQSTPRAGAFCDMLRAISEGEECATLAHRFLLDESTTTPARLRRSGSLNWAQIFNELGFYTAKLRDHSVAALPTSNYSGKPKIDEIDEHESALMLECYLRLTSHLCSQSSVVRSWLLAHPTFHVVEIFIFLCNSTIPFRLRACVFMALEALLTDKTDETGTTIWVCLDQWVSARFSSPQGLSKSVKISNTPARAEEFMHKTIGTTFEECSAFVGLLVALVTPTPENASLNDALPFPEQLGSAYRMAGIEPYVNFILGKVFAERTRDVEDPIQLRILRWKCLDFFATCLSTFNEDLVIIANTSTLSVDKAMSTSSLLAYTRLHPFARVMEWAFNERVLAALFASAHQDITEVGNATADSPLVLTLLRSIDVMNLIMDLQSTYLDIVRPLLKLQSTGQSQPVLNPSLASFEDSVATNLSIIVDLGLYVGAGYQELAISSLKLLGKLSSSRKLNAQSISGPGQRLNANRLIAAMEKDNEINRITRSLVSEMRFDPRELAQGAEAPGYSIKSAVLDFLNSCLGAISDRPTIAHLLLGFSCNSDALDVDPGGMFAKGMSLFHAIVRLTIEYPDGDAESILPLGVQIRQKGLQVLKTLFCSQLSSIYTLSELRSQDFLSSLILAEKSFDLSTRWNGRRLTDPEFMFTDSAYTLRQYLRRRCSLLEYACMEVRLVAKEGAPSLKTKLLSTLLGVITTPDGEQLTSLTIFDLLGFTELELPTYMQRPDLNYFAAVDFNISDGSATGPEENLHNLKIVQELVALRHNELRKAGQLQDPADQHRLLTEAQEIQLYYIGDNNRHSLLFARSEALKAWVELMTLTMETCELDQGSKTALILQALQIILPKLDRVSPDDADEAIEIARLIQALMNQLDFTSSSLDKGRAGDVANDRLFQVFRTSLRAIHAATGNATFRETLYSICYRYLTGVAEASGGPTLRRHNTLTLKAAGERLIDIICDDGYNGEGTCRVSALLLLDAVLAMAEKENSKYVIEALVRTNFIVVLVGNIQSIPPELGEAGAREVPLLLAYYDAMLSLLLRISQSKLGAAQVMNAGLFQAVRASELFAIDPDIGLDIDNPDALKKYYGLLLSVVRVITSVVLSRGPQNDQTIDQARIFLAENRAGIVAIFKRQAKIGGVLAGDTGRDLDELVEFYVLLITMTGFLDFEERRDTQGLAKSYT
ncbi:Nucleoporin Nup186/Nup192/Nup205 [Lasallia pustulata]|uniref:Nucleoporin Nup186/Nup192/Nup205 n=1 Tax=Lasallia pustulata TaxID=136370 RepID=A0A1W5D6Z1_9LECA|nr:Nucleoporin Nup186/Nup192/Nup205 [Lasallia pustulata]